MVKRVPYGGWRYLKGQCHILALALNEIFGYKMYTLEDSSREIVTKTGLCFELLTHTFCMKKGKVIDGMGIHSVANMKKRCRVEPGGPPSWKIRRVTKTTIMDSIDYHQTHERVTKAKLAAAKKFVLDNKERFEVK